MPDALAPRLKFGVIAPATNTIVQPEYDAMRPPGVSNQMARVVIPDTPVGTEDEFAAMMSAVRASVESRARRGDGVLARCSRSRRCPPKRSGKGRWMRTRCRRIWKREQA